MAPLAAIGSVARQQGRTAAVDLGDQGLVGDVDARELRRCRAGEAHDIVIGVLLPDIGIGPTRDLAPVLLEGERGSGEVQAHQMPLRGLAVEIARLRFAHEG